jgi:hypothetical protein
MSIGHNVISYATVYFYLRPDLKACALLVSKLPAIYETRRLLPYLQKVQLDPMLGQMKPDNILTPNFFKIQFNIILPSMFKSLRHHSNVINTECQ